ncbi:MAG: hypothetical protein H6717_28995 [Polyangiaceae bacterium]|nr:hypothetical protein [Polyangiaceae bacterium]
MKYAILFGVALFMLVSLVVGSRLLWLFKRTRKAPELFMALALLCAGFLAFAVGTIGKVLIVGHPELRTPLTILGLCFEYIGCSAMALFAWRVFHQKKAWAKATVTLFFVLAASVFAAELSTGEYLRYSDTQLSSGPWIPLALVVRGLAPTWLSFECFRFHRQLRRRARIGLAEPLVVQRVGLWGLAMLASALAYVVPVLHRLVYHTGLRDHLWAITTVSVLATVSAIALWWAFFPPQGYRKRMAMMSLSDAGPDSR